MLRTVIAGVVAGIVVMLWGAAAHMALPIGMMGMQIPSDASQQAAIRALDAEFEREGVYVLPMPQESQWSDEAAMAEFGKRSTTHPYAFVVFQPQGRDGMAAMGSSIGKQTASCIAAGLIAAFLASGIAGGRARRVAVVTSLGLFSWLTLSVPYWNWYRFPAALTQGALIEQVIGWLLGGIVIALILKPRAT
jgi:hypothetical protein